jgi:hypothetical protein
MNHYEVSLLCSICNQAINLELDRCTDEKGKAVHEICYLRKVVSIQKDKPSALSKFLRRKGKIAS